MDRRKKAIHEEEAYWSGNLEVEIEWEDIEAKYSKVFKSDSCITRAINVFSKLIDLQRRIKK